MGFGKKMIHDVPLLSFFDHLFDKGSSHTGVSINISSHGFHASRNDVFTIKTPGNINRVHFCQLWILVNAEILSCKLVQANSKIAWSKNDSRRIESANETNNTLGSFIGRKIMFHKSI